MVARFCHGKDSLLGTYGVLCRYYVLDISNKTVKWKGVIIADTVVL